MHRTEGSAPWSIVVRPSRRAVAERFLWGACSRNEVAPTNLGIANVNEFFDVITENHHSVAFFGAT